MITSLVTRSLVASLALLYGSLVFIQTLSSDGYASLKIYVSLAAILLMGAVSFFPRHYVRHYAALVVLFFLSSLLFFFFPENREFVFFFCVLGFSLDAIGTQIFPVLIQDSVRPALFQKYFNIYARSEILGKLLAGAVVAVLNRYHMLHYAAGLIWFYCALHLISLGALLKKPVPAMGLGGLAGVRDSWRTLRKSRLIWAGIILLIASQNMSLFTELGYWKAVEGLFPDAVSRATFMSAYDVSLNLLSFFLLQFVTHWAIEHFSLFRLASSLPWVVTAFAVGGLLANSMWMMLATSIAYVIVFRVLYRPVARQCLLPIPEDKKRGVLFLVTILSSIANLAAGFLVLSLKEEFDVTLVLMSLIVISLLLFGFLSQLDGLYIGEMWQHIKKSKIKGELESAASQDLDPEDATYYASRNRALPPGLQELIEKTPASEEDLSRLREIFTRLESSKHAAVYIEHIYRKARDPKIAREGALFHARLLAKGIPYQRARLIDLVFQMSPRLHGQLEKILTGVFKIDPAVLHEEGRVRETVEELMRNPKFSSLSIATQYQLRAFFMKVESDPRLTRYATDFDRLERLPDDLLNDLAEVLLLATDHGLLPYVFETITPGGDIWLGRVLENLEFMTLAEAKVLLRIIGRLSKYDPESIEEHVAGELNAIAETGPAIAPQPGVRMDRFIKSAYLYESVLRPRSISKLVRDSLFDLSNTATQETDELFEMHKRFLLSGQLSTEARRCL